MNESIKRFINGSHAIKIFKLGNEIKVWHSIHPLSSWTPILLLIRFAFSFRKPRRLLWLWSKINAWFTWLCVDKWQDNINRPSLLFMFIRFGQSLSGSSNYFVQTFNCDKPTSLLHFTKFTITELITFV